MASNIVRTASTFSSPSGSVSGVVKRAIVVMVGSPRAEPPTGDPAAAVGGQGRRRRRTGLGAGHDGRSCARSVAAGGPPRRARPRARRPRRARTLPAMERYTGVLYQELAWPTLSAAARRRGDVQVRTVSGLWGLVAPADPIPPYRLKMSASLDGLGRLSTWWRPRLSPRPGRADGGSRGVGPAPERARGRHRLGGGGAGPTGDGALPRRRGSHGQPLEQAPQGQPRPLAADRAARGPRGARGLPPPARLPLRPWRLRRSTVAWPPSCSAPPRRLSRVSAKPHFSDRRHPGPGRTGLPRDRRGCGACEYLDLGFEFVLVWIACSFVSILVHELGHGFALKAFGQPSVIVLHGFGGVTISQRRSASAGRAASS